MKIVITVFVAGAYALALLYLPALALGFGLRTGGSIYAEEGFGPLRITSFVLLTLLVFGGLLALRRITRRPA